MQIIAKNNKKMQEMQVACELLWEFKSFTSLWGKFSLYNIICFATWCMVHVLGSHSHFFPPTKIIKAHNKQNSVFARFFLLKKNPC